MSTALEQRWWSAREGGGKVNTVFIGRRDRGPDYLCKQYRWLAQELQAENVVERTDFLEDKYEGEDHTNQGESYPGSNPNFNRDKVEQAQLQCEKYDPMLLK